jgi:hypothetical protein
MDAEPVLVLTLNETSRVAVYRDRLDVALEGRPLLRVPLQEACAIADVVAEVRRMQREGAAVEPEPETKPEAGDEAEREAGS